MVIPVSALYGYKDEDYNATYAVVVDTVTKAILAAGVIKCRKHSPIPCVSFDRILFFKLDGTNNYTVREIKEPIVEVETKPLPIHFLVSAWSRASEDDKVDCYMERAILDEEVVTLVNALNKVKGVVTTGSCSGHSKNELFVAFHANSLEALIVIFHAAEFFTEDFVVMTRHDRCNTVNDSTNYISMVIISKYSLCDALREKLDALSAKIVEIAFGYSLYIETN